MQLGAFSISLSVKDIAASRAFYAVSYTHLRAHETVLDLVCRLLLEQKKYKTTSNLYPTKQTHTINDDTCVHDQ